LCNSTTRSAGFNHFGSRKLRNEYHIKKKFETRKKRSLFERFSLNVLTMKNELSEWGSFMHLNISRAIVLQTATGAQG